MVAIQCHYRRTKRRLNRVVLACAAIFSGLTGGSADAHIEVNVTRIGFPTVQLGHVVRSGAWVPIIVDVALVNQQMFDGTIRVSQFDNDGDECYDAVGIHLRVGTLESRRVYLYIPANPARGKGRFVVEVSDEDGEVVSVVSQGVLSHQAEAAQRPSVISDDDILFLSISNGTIGRLQDLVALDQRDLYQRSIHVAHMSPTDLPELWIGLEIVDYIVWDDARPEELTPRQIEALLTWVRRGGTLLIAASRSAGSLRISDPIRSILPVNIGDLADVKDLPNIRRTLLGVEDPEDPGFPHNVPVVECSLRTDAKRVPNRPSNTSDLISRRREGRGFVIFCGVTLNDLFSGTGRSAEFFQKLFHLSLLVDPNAGQPNPVPLFSQVVSAVAFSTSASLYLAVAGVFSIGYVLVATLGSWSLVSAKNWRRHSWSAFAVVAIAASVITLVTVNSVRGGFGETVHQVSVVDLDAGKTYGYATAFFGLKTGMDRRVDLWLPSRSTGAAEPAITDCFLRPLPAGSQATELMGSYADPSEYRLIPGSAVIENVRIRGTLKQFGGRWEGPLDGTLSGQITVRGRNLLEGSYIINDLGVDLLSCYLLHPVLDLDQGVGLRSLSIYAFSVGDIPSDGQKIELTERCYRLKDGERMSELFERSTLAKSHTTWGSPFRSIVANLGYGAGSGMGAAIGQEQKALLLMSTIGEFDPTQDTNMAGNYLGYASWSRECLRQLDLREQLTRDSVILLGFAEDPGPIRLWKRTGDSPYRPLRPDEDASWTMYRIRIPATLVRGPGQEEQDEDDLDALLDAKRARKE